MFDTGKAFLKSEALIYFISQSIQPINLMDRFMSDPVRQF